MIVPSIDLMAGQAVQLIGGREKALEAGDPRPLADRFGLVGEIAVIDLDAALGQGSNQQTIVDLLQRAPCRVGGGIRDLATAIQWLDAGAEKIILGTAAQPELLRELPAERVVVALDARDGEVVVEGWQKGTGRRVRDRMEELAGLAGGFLVTFVEREGRLGGTAMDRVAELVEVAGSARLTIAGGVSSAAEIAELDRLGADAQVGMAIYTGQLDLTEAFAAPLATDRDDGLWATVVVDDNGLALGLAWSDLDSLRHAIDERAGVYHSRSRGLWTKGKTSGCGQDLLRVAVDCDRDALRFTVRQHGSGFCHLGSRSCWGEDRGLAALSRLLAERAAQAPPDSYTRRLLSDPELLRSKLVEEARELAAAETPAEVAWEAADLIYFTLVAMARKGVDMNAVELELKKRAKKLTRRPGEAKPDPIEES